MQYENKTPLPQEQRFFANRVRKYVMNPDQDRQLEQEIKAGITPGLAKEWSTGL